MDCKTQPAPYTLHKTAIVVIALCHWSAVSAEFDLKPSIKSTFYAYQTEQEETNKQDNLALSVEPKLVGIYDSKKLDLSLSLAQTLVEQKEKADGSDKNYIDLSLSSKLNLIDKVLQWDLTGDQSYRTVSQGQDLFSDRLLSPGDLSKVRRYSTNLVFTTPNPRYMGFDWAAGYSDTSSEKSIDSISGLDGNNVSASARFYNGKKMQTLTFAINARYNNSERSNFSDFESTSLDANIKLRLSDQLRFVVTGRDEQNDADLSNQAAARSNLDTTSYGAGFAWHARDDRVVELTYNKLEEGNNSSNFIGVDLDWAFSRRTAIKANYGKRFYGDAYGLQFDYKLKYIKSSLSYNEDITTFARYTQSINSLGLFVCDIGFSDFAACFQPEDLNYELQAGEEFRTYNQISNDISNEVLLSKSARYELGYDKRKIKIALNLGYQETEYLESNRLEKYKTAGLLFNYKLGRRTDISLYTQLLKRGPSSNSANSENTNSVTLTGKRSLSKNANIDLSLRWLDRNSDNAARDATDKRLTVGFNYTF